MDSETITFDEKKFNNAVYDILDIWPVLTMARENGWARKNNAKFKASNEIPELNKKKQWNCDEEELLINFSQEISKYILDYDVSQYDLEDYLLDYMEDNFYVMVEDGSEKELAKLLLDVFEDIDKGRDDVVQKIKNLKSQVKKIKIESVKEEKKEETKENNEEKMIKELNNVEIDEKNNVPIVDEEGFTLVVKKKNKKKN